MPAKRKKGPLTPDGREIYGSITPGANPYNPGRPAANRAAGAGDLARKLFLVGGLAAAGGILNEATNKANQAVAKSKYERATRLSMRKSLRGQTRGR